MARGEVNKSKQICLNQIAAEIVEKNICPDLAKTAKNLVFGEGNPDAQVVFIGEAPGKNEDESGRPFVGAAGRVLDELLASISFAREDVYITSILKYRPPSNRDPKPAEKDAFLPFLQAQLKVIQPDLVVTLGRHSGKCFLPDLQIGRDHGTFMTSSRWIIFPVYHPAAVLYNGSMRSILLDDFAKIRTFKKNHTKL